MSAASGAPSEREPVDVRLASGAAAAWLAVLWGIHRSPVTLLLVAGVLGVTGLLILVRRAPSALALVVFCAALVLIPLAGRITDARAGSLNAIAVEHAGVGLGAAVRADPAVLAAKGVAGAPRVGVEAQVSSVLRDGRWAGAGGQVFVIADERGWSGVLPGQQVRLDGTLNPDLDGSALSVTLFARAPPQLIGRPPWWQRLAGTVRSSLRRAAGVVPDPERGLLPGLIDGDTVGLDPVLAERFRLAGLTHLVAVSGTNCSIVLGAVLLVLRRARVRPWLRAGVGVVVLALFVVVARPSPSVVRAALMALVALAALVSGRPVAALPALSAVVLALLLWDPTLAGSASFAMSALATAALLIIAPGWAAALRRRRVPIGVAESIAVAAAAHAVTAPVVAAISGRVSVVAIPANVLAEPVVAVTTVLGFTAAVVAPVWSAGGSALCWVAGWPCRWLVGVADVFGGLHGATVPWPAGAAGGLALLAVLIALWLLARRAGPRRVILAVAATAVVITIPVRSAVSGWPPSGWIFVACDVGQGDALVLNAGAGAAVEIDAGPDPVAIDRCLNDLGIDRIPLLVLSHFHLDHVAGLSGVGRGGRSVGEIVAGPLDEPYTGAVIVHRFATQRHLVVRTPPVGTHLVVGAVGLTVLGPAASFHGTRSDPNNSSLVLMATVDGVRIMLPGDAEIEAQQALLASGQDLRADVLKVPHHGSAYSDPAFLAAVHARVAVVSVGLHNDYGHPSPILLNEIARLGVPLLRTDHDGDVAITASDGQVRAVARGVSASTVGLGAPLSVRRRAPLADEPDRAAASEPGARMSPWHPARSMSTICPSRCRPLRSSSATRSSWSTGRSARSPPRSAARTPMSPRPP